jgi:hypothetical protein
MVKSGQMGPLHPMYHAESVFHANPVQGVEIAIYLNEVDER